MQAFHELASEGHEWVEVDDIARRALMRSGEHQGRRRLINSISDFCLGGRRWGEEKLLSKYRVLTEEIIPGLEGEGLIVHQPVEKGKQTAETPPVLFKLANMS